jgi:hypothetical protein
VKPPTAGPISFPTDSTSSTLPVEVTKPPLFIWQRWIPVTPGSYFNLVPMPLTRRVTSSLSVTACSWRKALMRKNCRSEGQPFRLLGRFYMTTYFGAEYFPANGILTYQEVHNGADSRLIMFDRAGKETKAIGTPGDLNGHRISPDGKRPAVVVLDSSVANYKLWVYDLFREKQTRLTFGSTRDNSPIWAPDGKSLVFASIKKGPYDLFEKRSDTTGAEEPVLQTAAAKTPTDWSLDGRFIAYTSTTPGISKAEGRGSYLALETASPTFSCRATTTSEKDISLPTDVGWPIDRMSRGDPRYMSHRFLGAGASGRSLRAEDQAPGGGAMAKNSSIWPRIRR